MAINLLNKLHNNKWTFGFNSDTSASSATRLSLHKAVHYWAGDEDT